MDYSHDADHPEGSSPWASSPKQSRDFGQRPADPTATFVPPQSPFGPAATEAANYSERPSTSDSTTLAVPENESHPQSPYQNHEESQQGFNAQSIGQQAPQPGQSAEQGRRPEAARYHARQPQKPQPQYKLQCKITALERTGKKDPILRFDAYVRGSHAIRRVYRG